MNEVEFWATQAFEIARDEHEENFSSRRGTGQIEGMAAFFLYDNNPYAGNAKKRDREHEELKRRMTARGFQVAASAGYPGAGEEQSGYTVAIIFLLGAFQGDTEQAESILSDEWSKVLAESAESGPSAEAVVINSRGGRGLN